MYWPEMELGDGAVVHDARSLASGSSEGGGRAAQISFIMIAIFCGDVSTLAPLYSLLGEPEDLQPRNPITFFQQVEELAWQLSIFSLLQASFSFLTRLVTEFLTCLKESQSMFRPLLTAFLWAVSLAAISALHSSESQVSRYFYLKMSL